ncbi:MAG TPA: amino acid permease C-terminal domain-containing protein, partial [Bacteroidia bacterium]|nr:amino acid permease C-terminal domain-containing protein [Bacteroidia bacterium]
FQMGQPRIWMSMSRDGLLPKKFSKVHPKFQTPSFATIVTGFVVAVPALFLNLTMVTDLCSIGTLFAFVLVCLGVLVLQNKKDIPRGKFKTPYINSKYIMSALLVLTIVLSFTYNKKATVNFITNEKQINDAKTIITSLNTEQIDLIKTQLYKTDSTAFSTQNNDVETYMSSLDENNYAALVKTLPIDETIKYQSGFDLFKHKIPMWVFIFVCFALAIWAFKQNLSLIPLLGLICCLYMMAELGLSNWIGFGIWLVVGLVVYFSYGFKKSKLNLNTTTV